MQRETGGIDSESDCAAYAIVAGIRLARPAVPSTFFEVAQRIAILQVQRRTHSQTGIESSGIQPNEATTTPEVHSGEPGIGKTPGYDDLVPRAQSS
jgi:hypothetical protein